MFNSKVFFILRPLSTPLKGFHNPIHSRPSMSTINSIFTFVMSFCHTRVNFINVLRTYFSSKILVPKITKLCLICFGFDIFWRQNNCIKECLVRPCSVFINSCKSESVKLLLEATPKVTNGQNSWTGWAKINWNKWHSLTTWKVSTNLQ